MAMDCILCGKTDLTVMDRVSIRELASIYRKMLGRDIRSEFPELSTLDYASCGTCGLKFFNPPVTGSPIFYDALGKKMSSLYYQEDKSEYQFAGSFITADDQVLDVGSGRGLFSRHVLGTYTGLDFNPGALEQAAKDGVRVLNESVEQHAGKLTTLYSVITAFQVLEHMSEPRQFIHSCLSILRPGGLLILSVPSEDSFIRMQENAVLNMPPHHVSRWTDQALINLQNIFAMRLVAIEHEKLAKIHFENFITLLSLRTVRTLLGLRQNGIVDISIRKKIIDRMARRLTPFFRKIHADPALWPCGHSVTAVYRKT